LEGTVEAFALSRELDLAAVAVTVKGDHQILLWRVRADALEPITGPIRTHAATKALAVDGPRLLAGFQDGSVELVDLGSRSSRGLTGPSNTEVYHLTLLARNEAYVTYRSPYVRRLTWSENAKPQERDFDKGGAIVAASTDGRFTVFVNTMGVSRLNGPFA